MRATFQILNQCIQHQWMSDSFDAADIYNCLEPFLSGTDELRWLSLIALYPLLSQFSDRQKEPLLLTQTDIEYLIENLRTVHSFHHAIKLMTHAITFICNVKKLVESGIVELLAEILNEENLSQEDQDNIVLLIEKIVTTDISSVDFQELDSIDPETPQTNVFIQQLEGKFLSC